jgi:hypothetical protein
MDYFNLSVITVYVLGVVCRQHLAQGTRWAGPGAGAGMQQVMWMLWHSPGERHWTLAVG